MVAKKPTEAPADGKVVRLIWDSADDLSGLYSNQMLVTHGETEFHLIFGHLTPPIALSAQELPDEAHIKPVIKLVVTPKFLRKMIDALTKNLESFEALEKED